MEIKQLIEKLEELSQNDNEQTREEISKMLSDLLNNGYDELEPQIRCWVGDLMGMDEIEGRKEPKILHMSIEKVKEILNKLKE